MKKLLDKLMRELGYVPIAEYEKVLFHRKNLQRLVHLYQDGEIRPGDLRY
jgi:hypothetical protein